MYLVHPVMDIRQQINEFFGKKKYAPRPVISPAVKRLSAIKLPPDLLKFLTLNPQKSDRNHKNALYWVIETDVTIGDAFPSFNNKNTKLVNDKLLYKIYQAPKTEKINGSSWFSFKDKMIYRWISDDGYFGFYKSDKGKIVKPIQYKVWMKKIPGRWDGV